MKQFNKVTIKLVLLLFIGLTTFFLLCPKVQAANSDYVRVKQNELIESDYLQAAQAIQIDGVIRGDAFLSGGVVTINGVIDGDLFVLAGKVVINGTINNNLRVIAGDVTVNAPIGRNALMVCGNCSVSSEATILGSILAVGGNFDLSAITVGRGIRFFGGRLYLNSPVGKEAFVVADKEFLLGPTASIAGNLKYTGSNSLTMEPGATVSGQISYERSTTPDSAPRFFGAKNFLTLYRQVKPVTDVFGFAISALIGFILLGLFPKGFEKVARAIENRPYASFGWGIVILLLTPLIVILFALTIVGIPVSLVLLFLSYLAWIGASYLTAFFLGRKILLARFGERRGWSLFMGLLIIYLLGLVPILGMLLKVLLITFTLGALLLSYKQRVIIEDKGLPAVSDFLAIRRGRGRPKKISTK